MSLSASVWQQFATLVLGSCAGSLRYVRSYVSKSETTFAFSSFWPQAVLSAFPNDSWAFFLQVSYVKKERNTAHSAGPTTSF